jgi:hypothetical protein
MNLKRNSEVKSNAQGHSPMKHMLHMVLCCGLPIVIILSLPFIASISPAIAGVLGVITPFICPVMMGGMMFMMFGKKKASCCEDSKMDGNKVDLSVK